MHLQNDHQGRPCRQFISGKIKTKFFCTIKFSTAFLDMQKLKEFLSELPIKKSTIKNILGTI
jgi:hypothetical protein